MINECAVLIPLKENCRRSLRHKIMNILYTRWTHGQIYTDTWADRQADSSIAPKTFILQGYNDKIVSEGIESKGDKAVYQHFLLFNPFTWVMNNSIV